MKRPNFLAGFFAILSGFSILTPVLAGDVVWFEGEKPIRSNFPAESWFSPSTFADKRTELSGGDWLSISGRRGPAEVFALYEVVIPTDGTYHFWTRKFWKHGPFKWRFADSEWRTCGRDIALADETPLRKFVEANWVSLGQVDLKSGPTTLEIRLIANEGDDVAACFDCFVLSVESFTQNGKIKPGEKSGLADEGFFAWEPGLDSFSPQCPIDLRHLNERVAGQSGFLKQHGDQIHLGDGKPARFWAVNIGPNNVAQDRASVDYMARKLAKLGVNMVRIHGKIFDFSHDPNSAELKQLDDLMYTVSALKKEGIYSHLSFTFPLWFEMRSVAGIDGYDSIKNKHPFGLLYFNPVLQSLWREHMKKSLSTMNPYTGLTLGEDPGLGVIEIINEDSLFFWTFSPKNIPAVQWSMLEKMFGQWLTKRHGSIAQALKVWRFSHEDDDAKAGVAGLFDAWHMTAAGIAKGGEPKRRRIGDQVRFLAELQRGFYDSTTKFLRDECKVGGLISASNWKTADASMLEAIEHWTYTPTNIMDRHGYFGGEHKGARAGYSVHAQDTFKSLAAAMVPDILPILTSQVEGYPQFISEIGWTNPNRHRADATFIGAAVASLQGTDGLHWFALGSNYLNDTAMQKFPVSVPTVAGTFPAAALMYRRGDVKQAEPAVYQRLDPEDLFAMKGTGRVTPDALDALRASDVPPGDTVAGEVASTDPLAGYVGPIVRSFGKEKQKSFQLNLSKYIDRNASTVTSATRELNWDFKNGLIRLETSRAQAAAGFLGKAGQIDLGDFFVTCGNEYACILIIALDDQPLRTSKSVLIQVSTDDQPYGFKVAEDRIADVGRSPYGIEKLKVSISMPAGTLVALDENGMPKHPVDAKSSVDGGRQMATLAPDAMYHLFTRP